MAVLRSTNVVCSSDRRCSEWARKYMDYCLCSSKDGISLALGTISIVSWTFAELPQIITNYKKKSAEGLSMAFLLTWLVGDLLNVFGCLLEPATLPTQYYTAMLYTLNTLILTMQAIYYGHIYHRLKAGSQREEVIEAGLVEKEREHDSSIDNNQTDKFQRPEVAPNLRIRIPPNSPMSSPRGELYYMSARSLSMSHTPPAGSFLAQRNPFSDAEWQSSAEPLLDEVQPTESSTPQKNKAMLCVASFVMLFLGSSNMPQLKKDKGNTAFWKSSRVVIQAGRQLLQVSGSLQHEISTTESSGIGSLLGWGMAIVYMGGRLPQIYLNIKRGNAEGLNPLMFVFALVGNSTYMASILVSSLDWRNIKPNLPWLVDAIGCMLLDTFILIMFIYFRYRSSRPDVVKRNLNGSAS